MVGGLLTRSKSVLDSKGIGNQSMNRDGFPGSKSNRPRSSATIFDVS